MSKKKKIGLMIRVLFDVTASLLSFFVDTNNVKRIERKRKTKEGIGKKKKKKDKENEK